MCSSSEHHLLDTKHLQGLAGDWGCPETPLRFVNSCKATPSQLPALGSVPGPLLDAQGNDLFQTRKSSIVCGVKPLPIIMWTHLGTFTGIIHRSAQFGVRQHKPPTELPESLGLGVAEIHQSF